MAELKTHLLYEVFKLYVLINMNITLPPLKCFHLFSFISIKLFNGKVNILLLKLLKYSNE